MGKPKQDHKTRLALGNTLVSLSIRIERGWFCFGTQQTLWRQEELPVQPFQHLTSLTAPQAFCSSSSSLTMSSRSPTPFLAPPPSQILHGNKLPWIRGSTIATGGWLSPTPWSHSRSSLWGRDKCSQVLHRQDLAHRELPPNRDYMVTWWDSGLDGPRMWDPPER